VQADGLIRCRRVPDHLKPGDEHEGFVFLGRSEKDPQWGQFRAADDPVLLDRQRQRQEDWERDRLHRGRPSSNGTAHLDDGPDMDALARRHAHGLTPERAAELAEALGLRADVLARLPLLGYSHTDPLGSCWTFPEHDGAGRVIGLTRRYRDGAKVAITGGHRGLIVPERWDQGEGPVFLVEGPSDTMALLALNLTVLGRPSNTGGAQYLAELLKGVPADREIVVVAEYDTNDKGQWPGLDGAKRTAGRLAEMLGRKVLWALPPKGAKDVRAWVVAQQLPADCLDAWHEAGQRLRAVMMEKAQDVKPPDAEGEAPAGFSWKAVDLVTLAAAARRPEMLVKRVLVRRQPMMVGAPHKTLKTSVMCDLAVSAATATPFLGHFDVYHPAKVALFSGESGEWTLAKTLERVCQGRGIDFAATVGRLVVQADGLPQLSNVEHMDYLRRVLERERVELFVLDPLYLTLLAGMGRDAAQASNLYEMGPLFQNVTRACLEVGATPVLVHHTKRGAAASREPLGLEDLAYAGVAEFARQWLLLSRREPYDGAHPGSHKLWMNAGGSAGHGGLWALDIEEGEADDDLDGRVWDVTVSTATEQRETARSGKELERIEKRAQQDRDDDAALLGALDRLGAGQRGAAYVTVRTECRLSKERMERAYFRLRQEKLVEDITVRVCVGNGAERDAKGIRRPLEGAD
jgi:hypothetical protein